MKKLSGAALAVVLLSLAWGTRLVAAEDQTVVFRQGAEDFTGTPYVGTSSLLMRRANPETNWGKANTLIIGRDYLSLLRFDLSHLEGMVGTVKSASLKLHFAANTDGAPIPFSLYRVAVANANWIPGERSGSLAHPGEPAAAFKAKGEPGQSDTPWASGGIFGVDAGDYGGLVATGEWVPSSAIQPITLELPPEVVWEWINGDDPNAGLFFRTVADWEGNPRTFYSSNYGSAGASVRPELTIVYSETVPEPAEPEPPITDWTEVNGVPIPVPPPGRPRLFLRDVHLPELAQRMNDPELSRVWAELNERSQNEDGGFDPGTWRYYLDQRGTAVRVELDSLLYLIHGDQAVGRSAVDAALTLLQETEYPTDVGDIARAAGRRMVTGAIVYDWCYDLLTESEKQGFIAELVRLAQSLESGYPPTRGSSVVGHVSEWMLMRDMLSAGIAIYDEYPDMYERVSVRLLGEHVPVRNWFYPGRAYHQGLNYDRVRLAADLYTTWIYDRMGAGNVFDENQQHIPYTFIYRRRPDGQVLPSGDFSPRRDRRFGMGMAAMLAANYYQDEYVNFEYLAQPSIESHDKLFEFLWRDTSLGVRVPTDLPLTQYSGFPFGWMVARTGWGGDSVIAEMKVNAYNFLNHQHLDGGSFQIFHQGPLAIDSGVYNGSSGDGAQYNSPHNKNYAKRTIAHNSLLVYDPDELFPSHSYGGAHRTDYVDNDGGQRTPGDGWRAPMNLDDLLNLDYKTGEILAHGFGPDFLEPEYSYLKGDITDAYSDKVSEVRRAFVFLNFKDAEIPAALIVHDKVVSTNPDFKKYWLLHSIEEPEIAGPVTTIRRTKDGDRGKLVNFTLKPEPDNLEIVPVGGPGKEFWVFGTNYENEPGIPDPANERGEWRIEVSPVLPKEENYFLNVLQVMDRDQENLLGVDLNDFERVTLVEVGEWSVGFSRDSRWIDDPVEFQVTGPDDRKILLTDLSPGRWEVRKDGVSHVSLSEVKEGEGTLFFSGPAGNYRVQKVVPVTRTFVFQDGTADFRGDTYSGTDSTFLRNGAPEINWGAAVNLIFGRDYKTLLRFDLSSLEGLEGIQEATLTLTHRPRTGNSEIAATVHILARENAGWIPGGGNNHPAAPGEPAPDFWARGMPGEADFPWGSGGRFGQTPGDYDPEPAGEFTWYPGDAIRHSEIALPPEIVMEWIQNPGTNAGLVLRSRESLPDGWTGDTGDFYSDNQGVIEARPKLTIVGWGLSGISFLEWAVAEGIPAERRDPLDYPAGDGISNLMKFALGLPAMEVSVAGMPVATMTETGGGKAIALQFRRPFGRAGVEFRLERSQDLENWQEVDSVFEILEELPDGVQLVRMVDPEEIASAERRFLRLVVELNQL